MEKNTISYLEFPVLFMFHYKKFYVGAGPAISFKLFSWMKAEEHRARTDFYNTTDLSSNILTGYELSKKVAINIRYSHGLTDVSESIFTAKNRFLNLSVLYRLK